MATEAVFHDGAMVALFVDAATAAGLAVDGGEAPADLHVTIAYLGDADALAGVAVDTVTTAIAKVAANHPPLTGTVGGHGRFAGSHRDGEDAVWLVPDAVGITELRLAVVDALAAAGVPVDQAHGFTPHITVAYVPADAPTPEVAGAGTPLTFDEITVAWADQRTTFALTGEPPMHPTDRTGESFLGDRTHGETRELVQDALRSRYKDGSPDCRYVWVNDLTETAVIFEVESSTGYKLWSIGYEIGADDTATLVGDAIEVESKTTLEPVVPLPAPAPVTDGTVNEASVSVPGRVLESKGTRADGARVFRMQIVEVGTSKNGVLYSSSVLEAAAALYEGAKAFDHHRTPAELATSTVDGLVGSYRNIESTAAGLEGDFHVLPSAVHIAEALDASLEAQAAGLPPLVGVSHDVALSWREAVHGDRKVKEAIAVRQVLSVDVVADPSAGGRVTRTVEGGILDTNLPEEITMTTLAELLAGASDEDKATLRSLLGDAPAGDESTRETEATAPAPTYDSTSPMGALLVATAVKAAGLDDRLTESITKDLGDRFTEADLASTIETVKRVGESFEVAGLRPNTPHVVVGTEDFDKKVGRLDRMLEGTAGGYPSIKAAYADITGISGLDLLDAELAYEILRESAKGRKVGERITESVTTSTWAQVLGDAMHRRLVAVYQGNNLAEWRDLVSSIVPRTDFRPNHVTRLGGYGALPAVAEGASYDPLTSPPDEEATYTLSKRGGTEDLTLEAIANDDVGAVRRIPIALGRAAALTLHRFVIDTLVTANPTLGYDSVALFHASHANTAAMALTADNLAVARRKMRKQAAYGVAADVLGIVPKFLWVPADLEKVGWELTTSAVAVTSTSDATLPNLHQQMELRVVDHWSDPTDWYVTADPTQNETIELGFFNGKEDPEIFVQDDPKVGANFTNDKVTWKIRHIYSGTVVDHRGFQRGTVADA